MTLNQFTETRDRKERGFNALTANACFCAGSRINFQTTISFFQALLQELIALAQSGKTYFEILTAHRHMGGL